MVSRDELELFSENKRLRARVQELESDNKKLNDILLKEIKENLSRKDWQQQALPYLRVARGRLVESLGDSGGCWVTDTGTFSVGEVDEIMSKAEADHEQG